MIAWLRRQFRPDPVLVELSEAKSRETLELAETVRQKRERLEATGNPIRDKMIQTRPRRVRPDGGITHG